MFYMGCYDIDNFKDFFYKSDFLNLFDIEEEEMSIIKDNDAEMLKISQRWLKYALYKEPVMLLKTDA
ncbi:Fe-S oxidoreductase, partial [Candidatus Magnetoovum chiemensis]